MFGLQGDRLSVIKSKVPKTSLNTGLSLTCREGHKELVGFVIAKGANDRNMALYGTCSEGYKELT